MITDSGKTSTETGDDKDGHPHTTPKNNLDEEGSNEHLGTVIAFKAPNLDTGNNSNGNKERDNKVPSTPSKDGNNLHDHTNGETIIKEKELTNRQLTNDTTNKTLKTTKEIPHNEETTNNPQHLEAVNSSKGTTPSLLEQKEVAEVGILKRTPAKGM